VLKSTHKQGPEMINWKVKIKRYTIKGKIYWYKTEDGGINWVKISTKDAMMLIDQNNGAILAQQGKHK
jgi:hypothetical protein